MVRASLFWAPSGEIVMTDGRYSSAEGLTDNVAPVIVSRHYSTKKPTIGIAVG